MAHVGQRRATVADLARTPGKAELIDGSIVHQMPTGYWPNQVAFAIAVSLRQYKKRSSRGAVCTDNLGFVIPELPSGRESFCPDAAFYDGPLPTNRMRFIEGPPTLAVEVRSENNYGPA